MWVFILLYCIYNKNLFGVGFVGVNGFVNLGKKKRGKCIR